MYTLKLFFIHIVSIFTKNCPKAYKFTYKTWGSDWDYCPVESNWDICVIGRSKKRASQIAKDYVTKADKKAFVSGSSEDIKYDCAMKIGQMLNEDAIYNLRQSAVFIDPKVRSMMVCKTLATVL